MFDNEPARVAAFLAALHRDQARHAAFFADGAVEVWPGRARPWVAPGYGGDVELENLAAEWPGRGWAGAVMRRLAALADLHAVSIFVVARARPGGPDGPPGRTLGQSALIGFYARRGFRTVALRDGNGYMLRPCRALDAAARRAALRELQEPPQWRGLPVPGEGAALDPPGAAPRPTPSPPGPAVETRRPGPSARP